MGMMGPLPPMALERLGLSDQQGTEVRALLDKNQAGSRSAMEHLRQLEQQLTSVLFSDAPASGQPDTRPSIEDLRSQIAAAQAEALAARIDVESQIAKILTPEQREQLLRDLKGVPAARSGRPGPRGPAGSAGSPPPPQT
jgi:Spy/CpxP family protein refolding chaperone